MRNIDNSFVPFKSCLWCCNIFVVFIRINLYSLILIFRLAIFTIGQPIVFWTKFCERRVLFINWNILGDRPCLKFAFVTWFCNSTLSILNFGYVWDKVTDWKFPISFPKHRLFCLPILVHVFGCSLMFKVFPKRMVVLNSVKFETQSTVQIECHFKCTHEADNLFYCHVRSTS